MNDTRDHGTRDARFPSPGAKRGCRRVAMGTPSPTRNGERGRETGPPLAQGHRGLRAHSIARACCYEEEAAETVNLADVS